MLFKSGVQSIIAMDGTSIRFKSRWPRHIRVETLKAEAKAKGAFYLRWKPSESPSNVSLARSTRVDRCLILPAIAFAERSDVRDVVAAVPSIECEILIKRDRAELGVAKFAREISRRERAQEQDPAPVEVI